MIFWDARGIEPFVVRTARLESAFWVKGEGEKKNTILGVLQGLLSIGGSGFLNYVSLIDKEKIEIYRTWKSKTAIKREELFFVNESSDLEKIPKSVVVETENIEFMRELFARGLKVSWFRPNLFKNSHWLSIFNFHHIFVKPAIIRDSLKVVLPDTRIVKLVMKKEEEVDSSCMYFKSRKLAKYKKLIGYRRTGMKKHFDMFYVARRNIRLIEKGAPISNNEKISVQIFNDYFNILSITYIVWRQSTVMNATKKSAPKDLLEQFVL